VGILFRTFLDLLFLPSPLLSILSKILRGHIVPHFLGYFLLLVSFLFLPNLFSFFLQLLRSFFVFFLLGQNLVTLRGHIVPHFHKILLLSSFFSSDSDFQVESLSPYPVSYP